MNHTPIPWQVHDYEHCGNEIYGNLEGPLEDGQIHGIFVADTQADADAEFICVAVNAHYDLVAALQACLKYIPGSEVHQWPPGFKLKEEAMRLAKAALVKARGKP